MALQVVGHREGVERAQGGQAVAVVGEQRDVAGQGRRVAGDVDDPAGRAARQRGDQRPAEPAARRVGDDDVRRRRAATAARARPRPVRQPTCGRSASAARPSAHGLGADSTTATRPVAPDLVGEHRREQPDPAVEVPGAPRPPAPAPTPPRPAPARRPAPGAPARTSRVRAATRARRRVARPASPAPRPAALRTAPRPAALRTAPRPAALGRSATCRAPSEPTATSTSPPAANRSSSTGSSVPAGVSGQSSTGSTSWLRCARRPARPSPSTASRTRCRQPQQPAGQLLDDGSGVDLARRPRRAAAAARGRTAALSSRCSAPSACCQSQPPQPPGPGPRARRLDPVGRRDEHRDRVGAAEGAAAVLGDDRAHPLARQRVPDEAPTRPSCRATQCPPCATAPTSRSSTRSVQSSTGPAAAGGGAHDRGRPAPAGASWGGAAPAVRPSAGRGPGRRTAPRAGRRGARARTPGGTRRPSPRSARRRARTTRAATAPMVDHDAGLEQQPGLEPQRALVVQDVLPPVPDDVLRDEDGRRCPAGSSRRTRLT